jgi:threonine synthase
MGFPFRKLVIATNENNILHRIINNNDFTLTDVIKTNSPSMDITISSNFERILSEFIDTSTLVDLYQKMPNKDHEKSIDQNAHKNLSDHFISTSATSDEVIAQIKKIYENFNLIVDPHTAVGLVSAEKLKIKGAMCLSCAHPVKFQDTVKKSINGELQYEKNFKFEYDEKFDVLKNNYHTMKEYIQNHA